MLLLIGPTVFFMPKFFEIRTKGIPYAPKVRYNCTEHFNENLPNSSTFDVQIKTYSRTGVRSKISKVSDHEDATERVCNHMIYLIRKVTTDEVPMLGQDDSKIGPKSKEIANSTADEPKENTTLDVFYNISTHVATVTKEPIMFYILDQTSMRKNPLYYKIYILGLTTLFAQIIPMVILIYLNIKIWLALRTTTGNHLANVIRTQRKKYKDMKNGKTPQ